ncbi:MAG: response regulator [Spirochaetales bacterium]|nr:response regulator [Leptospiraceae bacterium]MCP5483472.1 response regulator [Spirochaetales bacterium]MCP5486541.1 response regulator [Spirochaetales bacterium]
MAEPAKVLIVEDDPDEQALMERYITSFGYNVQTAPDGDVALERVKDWEPDLVLLDLHLPNVPGMIVLREIRENPALTDLPILVISGDESEETAIVCLSSGANEFIHKPVRMSELTVKVQNALELQDYKLRLKDLNRKLEREKSLLTRYFAKDLVEKLLNEEISADLGGTNLPATIMFVDMRDSTAIAERMAPEDFAAFLSTVLSNLMEIIFDCRGSVNKLTGDGVLATFGCPVPTDDDAFHAARCALRIRDFVQEQNQKAPPTPDIPLRMGIGIASGIVFAGNVGSSRRMEYTVLGDPVNLASRLEGLTKRVEGGDIMLDGATKRLVEGRVKLREAGIATVRGKEQEVELYVLTDLA